MLRRLQILILALFFALEGCCQREQKTDDGNQPLDYDRVLVLYYVGYNIDLPTPIMESIEALSDHLPSKDSRDAVVCVSRLPGTLMKFRDSDPAYFVRLYNCSGSVVMDTLKVYPAVRLTDAGVMKDILSDVQQVFKARSYGFYYSSHGPLGVNSISSIGLEFDQSLHTYSTDVAGFAKAIPMHLDYLILDACNSGSVEMAYQFKDVASRIVFSPTVIPLKGLDYLNILNRLLPREGEADLKGIVDDAFQKISPADSIGLTLSVVQTYALDSLAALCRTLFRKYRSAFASIEPSGVQPLDCEYDDRPSLFDMEDIFFNCKALKEKDIIDLKDAIDRVVVYCRHTPAVSGLTIDRFCGMGMYLPCKGNEHQRLSYGSYAWNRDTRYVLL